MPRKLGNSEVPGPCTDVNVCAFLHQREGGGEGGHPAGHHRVDILSSQDAAPATDSTAVKVWCSWPYCLFGWVGRRVVTIIVPIGVIEGWLRGLL